MKKIEDVEDKNKLIFLNENEKNIKQEITREYGYYAKRGKNIWKSEG